MAHTLPHNIATAMVELLCRLVELPSFSREEDATATLLYSFLQQQGVAVERIGNNVIARNKHFNATLPTFLLNSHHDTVKPNTGYTRNPFEATIEDGKLYGLGSNDAGGPLVSLLGTFLHFNEHRDLNFNLLFVASAEEEVSGSNGIESLVSHLGKIDIAIVGEPTQMRMAVAERGLMVLDCVAKGKAGHAANNEGVNAIYLAMKDIEWFRTYQFEKASEWLGPVKMSVTVINAGQAHNQIPAECKFVVDVRLNECYTHQELLSVIRKHVSVETKERSTRIKPSFIEDEHPMVLAAKEMGIEQFGSATTSDMALMPWKAVKIGPGDTNRSHSADEFIYVHEIEHGIETYIKLIHSYSQQISKQ
jgi:acetylornithine deacetylase